MQTVVAGIIEGSNDQVLMVRSGGGAWEFPSAPAKPGESAEAAMRRAAREKLGVEIDIRIGQPPLPGSYDGREAAYRFFIAGIERGSPAALGYSEFCWMSREDLRRRELAPLTRQIERWYTE